MANIVDKTNQIGRKTTELAANMIPASIQNNGLMAPKDKRLVDSLNRQRTKLIGVKSVNDLEPGFYSGGVMLKDVPIIDGLTGYNEWFIEVSKTVTGDKLITATQVATGSTWRKVIALAPTNVLSHPTVWSKVTTETILWAGSADLAVGTKLTLVDDMYNYDGLIVNYYFDGVSNSARLQASRADALTGVPPYLYWDGTNMSNTLSDTVLNMEFFEAYLEKVDNTHLKFSSFNHIVANLAKGTAVYNTGNGDFMISQIIGVR
ncbi:minor head protein [Lactobacillus phage phig1e]|uniref:minor head protein n=1 Tax=Lactobacillus phage phig1e TaxID=52979 RepID=UPI000009C043|nr:minor head protein [Lactobacillus phage phig1e]CAA62099.1 capsid protein [Lactobacillus phage phig1e]CAA66749.1 minor capsid protein [Lactobacillus phage phig1e]